MVVYDKSGGDYPPKETYMKTLRILLGISLLSSVLAIGPALAEEGDDGSEDDDEEGDTEEGEGDTGAADEEAPAAEEAPAEPEPAPMAEAPAEEAPAEEAPAAAAAPDVSWSLDARERARITIDTNGDWAVHNRASAGLEAGVGPVSGRIEINDYRMWGDDIANGAFNIEQAYASVDIGHGLSMSIGRQPINWHNGRLVSDFDWGNGGATHDGIRLGMSKDKFELDAFWSKVSLTGNSHVVGLRAGPRMGDALNLDGVALIDFDTDAEHTRATVGAHAHGAAGLVSYEVEGYAQVGSLGDSTSYGAFMVGAQAGVSPEHAINPYIGGGIDVLSGDGDAADDTLSTFVLGGGDSHRYNGHFDRWAGGNGDRGLIDGHFNLSLNPYSVMTVAIGIHAFAAMESGDDDAFEGFEADIDLSWSPWDQLDVLVGIWLYKPAEGDLQKTIVMQADFQF